jgi:hypothetical protein
MNMSISKYSLDVMKTTIGAERDYMFCPYFS